jgi:hypothetical protein
MTAQIIDFPMDRVRKPATQRPTRSRQPYQVQTGVRTSVKIARVVLFISLVSGILALLLLNSSAGLSPAQARS